MKNDPASSWDFPAVLLLYLILIFSALRLITTNWTSDLYATLVLVFLGATIGLMLGASRFRPLAANLLALAYSLVLIPWTLGDMLYENIPWFERLTSIFWRLGNSLVLFLQKKPVDDTLLFITLIAIIYWNISLLAGYQWSRYKKIVPVLLPAWVMMVTIQVYDNFSNNHIYYLIFCMFFSLLLVGRRFILKKQLYWNKNHIHTTSGSSHDLTMMLVAFTTVIILLAWVIPVNQHQISNIKKSWDRFSESWQSTRKFLGNAVAGLESNLPGQSNDIYGSDFLLLGQKAITGNTAIFNVRLPPGSFSNHNYWRVRIYDQFNNDKWSNGKVSNLVFEPHKALLRLPDSGMSSTSEFTFTITQGHIFNLSTPAQTVWISRPAIAEIYQLENKMVDPVLLRADIAIHAGESYQVQAIESDPSILDLRRAGQNYPDWVLERYLQRPDDLSKRVITLAAQLTAGKTNPYDKIMSITNYLRREITYTKEIANPPLRANILEWFLLDYKQGYCNYYATAEVILLREVGIPARMVVGFAQGERMPGREGTFIVRQKDAHAWPEVYFPGIGWVEFEPTSSQTEIQRPTGIIPTVTGSTSNNATEMEGTKISLEPPVSTPLPGEPDSQLSEGNTKASILVYLLYGAIIICLSGFMFWYRRHQWHASPTPLPIRLKNTLERNSIKVPAWLAIRAEMAGETPIQRSFYVIYKSLKRLGKDPSPADTPLTASSMLMECLPAAAQEIASLRDEYLRFVYSQQATDVSVAIRSSKVIRQQTNRAVFYNIINLIKRGFKPLP